MALTLGRALMVLCWLASAAAELTCGDIRDSYRANGCCGAPAKEIDMTTLEKKNLSAVGAFMCESPMYDLVNTEFHPDFPPKSIIDQGYEWGNGFQKVAEHYPAIGAWFEQTFATKSYEPMALTQHEKEMYLWSAVNYTEHFKAGKVTAEEYATALVKRMQHYKLLNAFMVTSYMLSDKIIDMAREVDEKAKAEGVESVAPLYGLPVPAKGTMATVDFPSSAGLGILDGCYAVEDAELIKMIKAAHGVVMGKTNVPEFACSWQTMNHLNGVTRNPYNFSLAACGSSGGSASAVAAYIAPLSITEDTGGSTRCPAHANGNFGYDPSRNKWPNDGNPGITHFRDQLGMNARSMDDILFFDKAVLNMTEEHAAAEAAVDSLSAADIKVGFPDEVFVTLNVPQILRDKGMTNMADLRASTALRDALASAKTLLSDAGMTVVEEDWPTVDSPTLGSVNALYHLLYGFEYAPGEPFWYSVCAQTFTGQIAQWMHNYLRVKTTTIAHVIDDTRPVGDSHGPSGCFKSYNGKSSESQLRWCSVYQVESPEFWNMYYDLHGVDMILVPTQYTPIQSYAENAMKTVPVEMKQENGAYVEQAVGNTGTTGSLHYSYFKMMHIPKVTIPVGLDPKGRPMSLTAWGRAMPGNLSFCDECSKTFDLEFLYKVKKVVSALHAASSPLLRVDSALAMGDLA